MQHDAIIRLKIKDLSWNDVRFRFEDALKKRVGSGKPMSIEELSDHVGVHLKTAEGWYYVGTEPSEINMKKLEAIFGADFYNEIYSGIEFAEHSEIRPDAFCLADRAAIRKALTKALETIDDTLNPESNVTKLERTA